MATEAKASHSSVQSRVDWRQVRLALGGLVLAATFVIAVYLGVREIVRAIFGLDKQLAAAVVATSGTVIAAVAAVMYGQWRTRLREIAEAHRPKKIELYQKFMDQYVRILRESREGKLRVIEQSGEPSDEFKEFYFSFNRDLIVWGSAGVIRA